MRILARFLAEISLVACLVLHAHSIATETFEDRWSIIPKANAEPAAPKPEASPGSVETVPQKNTQSPSGAKSTRISREARSEKRAFSGKASFYSYSSGKTASGSAFNRNDLTAAHRTLPFGTKVRVTDAVTKKSVVVVINDRGPWRADRVLDLSLAAARTLGIKDRGVVHVRADVL